jgi:hypothetical protein
VVTQNKFVVTAVALDRITEEQKMCEPYLDEVMPQLFESFIDRSQAALPDDFLNAAKGVVVAGPDLTRGLAKCSDSDFSSGWMPADDGTVFHRDFCDLNGGLIVNRIGEFWYVQTAIVRERHRAEYWVLVVAFDNVPICTRTHEEAIRLAEHCHPNPRPPMPGCWVKNYEQSR